MTDAPWFLFLFGVLCERTFPASHDLAVPHLLPVQAPRLEDTAALVPLCRSGNVPGLHPPRLLQCPLQDVQKEAYLQEGLFCCPLSSQKGPTVRVTETCGFLLLSPTSFLKTQDRLDGKVRASGILSVAGNGHPAALVGWLPSRLGWAWNLEP